MNHKEIGGPHTFDKGYNERIFNNSLRGKFHFARFIWLKEKMAILNCPKNTFIELGCFDVKTIDYLPGNFIKYRGYDANWENGLEIARQKYIDSNRIDLVECSSVENFNPSEKFDISICMETFEHLPTNELEQYISKLAKGTKHYLLATVPNERGLFWLVKYISKITFYEEKEKYSFDDIINTTIGRVHKVERNEGGHKGFDIVGLLKILDKYFMLENLEYLPFKSGGVNFNMTVGLVLKVK